MEIVCIIFSIIIIIAGAAMAIGYVGVIIASECCPAKITGIKEERASSGWRESAYSYEVEFKYKRKTIRKNALNSVFLIPFFEKQKIKKYQERYTGQEVHVYYNPKNPAQILIKEQLWKIFLSPAVLLLLGVFALVMALI